MPFMGASAAVFRRAGAVPIGRGLKHRATLWLRAEHEPELRVYALYGCFSRSFSSGGGSADRTRAKAPSYALVACRA